MKTLRRFLILLPFIPSIGLAQSRISVNFEGGQLNPDLMGPGTAQVTGTAGVIPAANWNNFPDWIGTNEALVDHNGAAASATISYEVQNNWAATNTASGDGSNGDLMSGQLDNLQNSNAAGTPNNITVSNLGPEFTANGYDVYVYQNADSGDAAVGFIMDGATTIYLLQVGGAGANYPLTGPSAVDGFIVSRQTDPGLATSSNVVCFENMTGSSFTITGAAGGGGARPRPNGFQIVARSEIIDTDKDGLDDGWEIDNFGDITSQDGTGDPDLDTLLNSDEFSGGTDPNDADTDDDGLDDNVEDRTGTFVDATMTGTNPLNDDSDGDTLLDGDEVNADPFDSDPNEADTDGDTLTDDSEIAANPFVTDPRLEDTDNDTWSDAQEIQLGTDPTNPDDFPQLGGGNSIGINFSSDRQLADLAPEEIAGVSPFEQGNWNNFNDIPADVPAPPTTDDTTGVDSPVVGTLADSSGAPTGVAVSWSSVNAWNTNNAIASPDNKLMNGYIDNNGTFPEVVQVTLSNLDTFSTAYTVVAYFGSDGNDRTGTISATGGDTFGFATSSNQGGNFPAAYVQTTDTVGNPAANYAVWTGLIEPECVIQVIRGSSNNGIHGVQVVSEEPPRPAQINIIEYNPITGVVTLTWDGKSGVEYSLDWSTNLIDWIELTDGITGGEGVVTQDFTPTDSNTTTFFRFREAMK